MDKKNFNEICYDFIENLMNLINNSGIPLFCIYYILKDIFQQITELKDQEIIQYKYNNSSLTEESVEIPIEKEEE